MKLLFDQNISYRILKILPEKFVGSSHVKKESLINAPDREIGSLQKRMIIQLLHKILILTI
jgi:predicted nuclease of predicted toxin-antitoxin system